MIKKQLIVDAMHKLEDLIADHGVNSLSDDSDLILYEVLGTLRQILDDRDKIFVDTSEGGSGRESIKKSHRAEGGNFID